MLSLARQVVQGVAEVNGFVIQMLFMTAFIDHILTSDNLDVEILDHALVWTMCFR